MSWCGTLLVLLYPRYVSLVLRVTITTAGEKAVCMRKQKSEFRYCRCWGLCFAMFLTTKPVANYLRFHARVGTVSAILCVQSTWHRLDLSNKNNISSSCLSICGFVRAVNPISVRYQNSVLGFVKYTLYFLQDKKKRGCAYSVRLTHIYQICFYNLPPPPPRSASEGIIC